MTKKFFIIAFMAIVCVLGITKVQASSGTSHNLSTLAINFVDKETREYLIGGSVEINGQIYNIDEKNKVLIGELDDETVCVKVLSVPEGYLLEKTEYLIEVGHLTGHIENIKLTHKKGNLEINSELLNTVYELRTEDYEVVGRYKPNDNHLIRVNALNTGTYLLRQIEIEERI